MKGFLPWLNPEYAHIRRRAGGRHLYGLRDTLCVSCHKHFRKEDISKQTGRCLWCDYDRLPLVEQATIERTSL